MTTIPITRLCEYCGQPCRPRAKEGGDSLAKRRFCSRACAADWQRDFNLRDTCHIDDCDDPARGRGLCPKHYVRWQKHGDPYWDGKPSLRMDITYTQAHRRVRRQRGVPAEHECADCGTTAEEWSYTGGCPNELTAPKWGVKYSPDPSRYEPRCVRCHRKRDVQLLLARRRSA